MNLLRTYSSLFRWRLILRCLSIFSALVLLASASHGEDVASGFTPGIISDYAGDGKGDLSFSDGSLPTQVLMDTAPLTATDSQGNVYITKGFGTVYMVYGGKNIPKALADVTTNPVQGRIYQLASKTCGTTKPAEGVPFNQTCFDGIAALAIDSQDNFYYSENLAFDVYTSNLVRKVDATTGIVTTIAGTFGVNSYNVCTTITSACIGDGGPATSANFSNPLDIKLDSYGNLYILDGGWTEVVRVVYSGSQAPPILVAENISVPSTPNNYIYTVAGQPGGTCGAEGCGDGSAATTAILDYPLTISVDTAGNLYIADQDYNNYNGYIRVVYTGSTVPPLLNLYLNPNGGSVTPTSGYIYPVTGYDDGYAACSTAGCGDGELAANVKFVNTNGQSLLYMTLDDLGNLYIADYGAPAVRKIDTSGYASTIVGIDDPTGKTSATCSALSTNSKYSDDCLAVGAALTHPNQISFDANDNLYISDLDVVWKVAPLLAQNITLPAFDSATVTYGVNPIILAATSDTTTAITYAVTTSTPSGIGSINGSKLTVNGAGSITVDATQAQTNVYLAATSNTETLTVNPSATLVVTANDKSVTPGNIDLSNPGFTATVTGFVHGDTATTSGVYSGTPGFTTTATSNTSCGTFSITPNLGSLTSTNYSFVDFVDGTLSITGTQTQTLDFPAFSSAVTYGQTTSIDLSTSATASSGGTVTYTVVSGPGTIAKGTSILKITGAGSIVIHAIQQGTCTYAASPAVTQTLIVNPAPLTVTGPTVTSTYGITLDPTTFPAATISGFVGTDTASALVSGSAKYSIASTKPDAGTYAITVGSGTLALDASVAANYTLATYVNGSLIVNSTTQTINVNPITSTQTYGTSFTITATATSGLPVTYTLNGSAHLPSGDTVGLVVPDGIGTLIVTVSQAGNGNYAAATPITLTFTVGQAPLWVNVAKNYSRELGAANPTFSYTFGSSDTSQAGNFVDGDHDVPAVITGVPDIETAATQDSPTGTYPIVISQGTLSATNYYFVFNNTTLTVLPAGSYTITASPSSLTIKSGMSAQSTITITPVNLYQGTVTLSCGTLPTNVTCVISPSTYVFPGSQNVDGSENSAQGTVTITASGKTVVGELRRDDSVIRATTLLIPSGLVGLLIAFRRRRAAKMSGIWGIVALLALGVSMFAISSCGGSAMPTVSTGTTQLTITGSGTTASGSGSVTATIPLTITIE